MARPLPRVNINHNNTTDKELADSQQALTPAGFLLDIAEQAKKNCNANRNAILSLSALVSNEKNLRVKQLKLTDAKLQALSQCSDVFQALHPQLANVAREIMIHFSLEKKSYQLRGRYIDNKIRWLQEQKVAALNQTITYLNKSSSNNQVEWQSFLDKNAIKKFTTKTLPLAKSFEKIFQDLLKLNSSYLVNAAAPTMLKPATDINSARQQLLNCLEKEINSIKHEHIDLSNLLQTHAELIGAGLAYEEQFYQALYPLLNQENYSETFPVHLSIIIDYFESCKLTRYQDKFFISRRIEYLQYQHDVLQNSYDAIICL